MREISPANVVRAAISRESADIGASVAIGPDLTVFADSAPLGSAVGNPIRNAGIHAGPRAKVAVTAESRGDHIDLAVTLRLPAKVRET